jgi:hypothetical protein
MSLLSLEFFDFDILESSKLFSDVHAPLHILLSVNLSNNDSNSNTVRKTNHSKTKIKSWEKEKVTDNIFIITHSAINYKHTVSFTKN